MIDVLDLSGHWQVFLDPQDHGMDQKWYLDPPWEEQEHYTITLPGSLEQAGIGKSVTSKTVWIGSQFGTEFEQDPLYTPYHADGVFRFPYWLQPQTRYVGPAWYVKTVKLQASAFIHHWQLELERPHWETRVWANGLFLGKCDSLSVPHRYVLPVFAQEMVTLIVRVDNRMIWEIGPNAHSISDHTQGPWNGIVGKLLLRSVPAVSVGRVDIFPNIQTHSLLCRVEVINQDREHKEGIVEIRNATEVFASLPKEFRQGSTVCAIEVRLPQLELWDEFNPAILELQICVRTNNASIGDCRTYQVGLRQITRQDKSLFINNRRCFLRGTVECCVFPKTGAPPMVEKPWEHIFSQVKAYGLNHVRFHSWCPPEAAFRVADKIGIYLQVECPVWKNQGVKFDENIAFDDWLFEESERIVAEYGNHPSFVLFASGNEPDGRYSEILGLWAASWNQRDGRRLHSAASGWPSLVENAYQVVPEPRIQRWGEGLNSRINAQEPETTTDYETVCDKYPGPVVTHEMGQWCVFPDFSEMHLYTGYLKPRNFEIFRDILARRGLQEQAREFLLASGKHQLLCYKEEIESALRTRNLAGFQLLGLTDFPGQGTALVGVLNVFWQEKGYCTSKEFTRFCNDIVLLARLPKRTYRCGETCPVKLEISNFGFADLAHPTVYWKLSSETGTKIDGGTIKIKRVLGRGLQPIARLSLTIPNLETAQKLTLSILLEQPERENQWDIWVFPSEVTFPKADILISQAWDQPTKQALHEGKRVLLLAKKESIATDVEIGFSSVFWNTSWTKGQAPHTLGMIVANEHPVFAHFPTADHADWQWWELMHDAGAMILDDLPREVRPLVQPIDTWFRCHKLALLFECRVAKGTLMVCSMDLVSDLQHRIVARQFMYSMLQYLGQEQLITSCVLSEEEVGRLFVHKEV